MFLMFLGVIIFAIWLYALFIRPMLIAKYPEFGKFAAVEGTLFAKSRTILIARGYWIGGVVVGLQSLAASAGLDITPVVTDLAKWIPEGYRSLAISAFLFITGLVFEWLRRVTTAPVGDTKG